jgi:microcystin-dependent protein
MSHLPPNGRPFGNGNGTNGIKFDYSRINEITATMKEKLKKKYETSAQLSSDATSNANSDTPSDVSVLDSYITDIENLFLSGVYNGDLRVSGKIYADSIESANGVVSRNDNVNGTGNGNGNWSHSDSNEKGRRLTKRELQDMISAISDGLTWIRQEMKHAKIEDSRLIRCQFFHPDFVNEVRFRDNVNCEQKMRIGGIQDTNTTYALEVQGDTRVNGDITSPAFVGMVSYFAMRTAPIGWLKCNGDLVSRTTYSALFAAIGTTFGTGDGSTTFRLPDLRGEFTRGWDDGRNIDISGGVSRVFGTTQADELRSHRHYISNSSTLGSDENVLHYGDMGGGDNQDGTYTRFTGGSETRPRNVALLACIKY